MAVLLFPAQGHFVLLQLPRGSIEPLAGPGESDRNTPGLVQRRFSAHRTLLLPPKGFIKRLPPAASPQPGRPWRSSGREAGRTGRSPQGQPRDALHRGTEARASGAAGGARGAGAGGEGTRRARPEQRRGRWIPQVDPAPQGPPSLGASSASGGGGCRGVKGRTRPRVEPGWAWASIKNKQTKIEVKKP